MRKRTSAVGATTSPSSTSRTSDRRSGSAGPESAPERSTRNDDSVVRIVRASPASVPASTSAASLRSPLSRSRSPIALKPIEGYPRRGIPPHDPKGEDDEADRYRDSARRHRTHAFAGHEPGIQVRREAEQAAGQFGSGAQLRGRRRRAGESVYARAGQL